MIKQLKLNEFMNAAEVICKSFTTVAMELNLNKQNFPNFTAFVISEERLQNNFNWGWLMFGLYEDGKLVGYVSLSKENEYVYELHNLAVLPECRHKGYGKQLIDFCKTKVNDLNGNKIKIGIIKENVVLKNWYTEHGFFSTATKKFENQPTTVEFMECVI